MSFLVDEWGSTIEDSARSSKRCSVPQILQQSYTLDALPDEHQWYVFFPHTAALHADGFVI